jgi:hypothetical protein
MGIKRKQLTATSLLLCGGIWLAYSLFATPPVLSFIALRFELHQSALKLVLAADFVIPLCFVCYGLILRNRVG